MEFPETIIALITTHGTIPTHNSAPVLKTLDYPVNLYKLNATTYGVPFLCDADIFQLLCSKLQKSVDLMDDTSPDPLEVITKLKNVCIRTNRENTANILKDCNPGKQDNMNIYAHYSDLMFNIVQTKQAENYVDKSFILFQEDEIEKIVNVDAIDIPGYFNQIKLLNFHGLNVFTMLNDAGFKTDEITLSQLIEFLYNFCHMKHLILIDLTCSTTYNDERTDSQIRRELIKTKMY